MCVHLKQISIVPVDVINLAGEEKNIQRDLFELVSTMNIKKMFNQPKTNKFGAPFINHV